MGERVGFGIIGCGEVGQTMGGTDVYNGIGEWHAHYIQEVEGADLVAVADLKEENARALAEKFGVKHHYTDHHEMLARDDIEVVNICTPSGTHGVLATDAARAGKNIITEKPMEIRPEKAEEMVAEAEKAGVKLAVVFPQRFRNSVRKVRQAIEDGVFGDLIVGSAFCRRYRTQAYYSDSDWRGTWAGDGGGALMNQGIHVIDAFLHLMGPVESVVGRCATLGHEGLEVEDTAGAVIRFASGAIGVIEGTTCAYPDFGDRIDIHAQKGSAVLEGGRLSRWEHIDEEHRFDVSTITEATGPFIGHKSVFADMVEAVRDDRPPFVDGREGKRAVELICAIYQSSQEGREIRLQ
jgi:predicted dehydrogenase